MLTVQHVYKLSNVPDNLNCPEMDYTCTHACMHARTHARTHTPFTLTFKAYLTISMVLEDLFCSFLFLPVHSYFYPSIFVFIRPNDGWTGLYIKLYIYIYIYIYINIYIYIIWVSARPKFSWAILAKRSHFVLAKYNIV